MTSQQLAWQQRALFDAGAQTHLVVADDPDGASIIVISSRRSGQEALCQLLRSDESLQVELGRLEGPPESGTNGDDRRRVAVLDARGRGHDWPEEARAIVSRAPDCALIVVTSGGGDEGAAARDALRAGATGFVPAERLIDDLIPAVRAALDGDRFVSPTVGAQLAADGQDADEDVLTDRERAVLQLLGRGHTNAAVATQLYVSMRTVEAHRAALQRKLDISGRAELVEAARERGLI